MDNKPMLEQTKQILAALKCYGMLESLDSRLNEATSHGWGHSEFISALASDEKSYRESIKIKRRLKAANFRVDACFERLDLTAKRNLSKSQTKDLMELRFVKEPRNILLFGPTGVGKTYLASALGNQACRRGYTCQFIGVNLLMERLILSRADGSFLRFREKLAKVDLLILDDLGIKRLTPDAIQDLYDIMEERYQAKSTVITSQLPIANWKEVIEDPVALEAIVDRLIHGAIVLDLSGESYRKRRISDSRLTKDSAPVEINL
jgi:DNA replication protein DnaC